jgi:hypothetical protein
MRHSVLLILCVFTVATSAIPSRDNDEWIRKFSSQAAMGCIKDDSCRAKFSYHETDQISALAREIESLLHSHGFSGETCHLFIDGLLRNDDDDDKKKNIIVSMITDLRVTCADPNAIVESKATAYNIGLAIVGTLVTVLTFTALFVVSTKMNSLHNV